MPGGSSSRGGFVCYLILVVIFVGLGRAYRLWGEGDLKLPYGWDAKKGCNHLYGGN